VTAAFQNPFRPGAGHAPPYLAGRGPELREFQRLLDQNPILENVVLTGLRGVGKTVLLDRFKPDAIAAGWAWTGADLSESTSVKETTLATRLLTDLAQVTSGLVVAKRQVRGLGFGADDETMTTHLDFHALRSVYEGTPGLVIDQLKAVFELVWLALTKNDKHVGLVMAYDEAQNMADHAEQDEFPLSVLLDLFQSLQRKGVRIMLVLTGLPTLFPRLVEARTYAERMFRVIFLDRLDDAASEAAIVKPIEDEHCPVHLERPSIDLIKGASRGYPYFIQFICREVYDAFSQGQTAVPLDAITRKLDTDFFAGRWARATDRQRDLLSVIAELESCEDEFTVQEVVAESRTRLDKPFSASHVNQMLVALSTSGLVYKNRHGRYSFAVPLLGGFIRRQTGAA
jgi:hypothetical protein